MGAEVLELIFSSAAEDGITLLMVTHDMNEMRETPAGSFRFATELSSGMISERAGIHLAEHLAQSAPYGELFGSEPCSRSA